jgi:hypothetical protein
MLPDFHVVGIDFDTPEVTDWNPSDSLDCEVWATVSVGTDRGATYYQLHICTPQAVRSIADKRHLFVINQFRGIDELVVELDAFIESKVGNRPEDPYLLLSKHWAWEYEGMRRPP